MGDQAHWGLAGSTVTAPGGTIAGKTFFKNENQVVFSGGQQLQV